MWHQQVYLIGTTHIGTNLFPFRALHPEDKHCWTAKAKAAAESSELPISYFSDLCP